MPDEKPLISVVVAVFEAADTLQRCIDSVEAQTYPRKEMVVMDGGSTDGTVEILEANGEKVACWRSEPDRGIYHAWNKALERAQGDWICFLGADDYFADRDCLSDLVAAGGSADAVFGKLMRFDDAGRELRTFGRPWVWKEMKRHQSIAHPGALHRRYLFEKYGFFSESYPIAGDYEFLLRLGSGLKAAFVDRVTVCMGYGVSIENARQANAEARTIQRIHPEIGFLRAEIYYRLASAKTFLAESPAYRPIKAVLEVLRGIRGSMQTKARNRSGK